MSAAIGKLFRDTDPTAKAAYNDWDDVRLGAALIARIGNDASFLDQILQVQTKYDPDKGRITSWFARGASESRSKLLTALAMESTAIAQLLDRRYALIDLIKAQELKELQRQLGVELVQTQIHQQRYAQAEMQTNATLLKLAMDSGMSLIDYLAWRRQKAFDQQELDFNRIAAIQNIELDEYAKHMSDHQQLVILQKRLDVLYEEVYVIANSSEPEDVKKRKIESRERTIAATEDNKAAIENRLRQIEGNKPQGKSQANDPGNHRPPLGRDS